jgi:hypothetical protein
MSARPTVASTNARIDGIELALVKLTEAVTGLVASYATPAPVAEVVAPKASKARKAATKLTSVPTGKGAAAPATVTDAEARKLVVGGADAWEIHVVSTAGNVVPFGLVLRAEKAAARKAAPKATKPVTKATSANPMFKLSGAQLRELGTKAAKAEIARRAAK